MNETTCRVLVHPGLPAPPPARVECGLRVARDGMCSTHAWNSAVMAADWEDLAEVAADLHIGPSSYIPSHGVPGDRSR